MDTKTKQKIDEIIDGHPEWIDNINEIESMYKIHEYLGRTDIFLEFLSIITDLELLDAAYLKANKSILYLLTPEVIKDKSIEIRLGKLMELELTGFLYRLSIWLRSSNKGQLDQITILDEVSDDELPILMHMLPAPKFIAAKVNATGGLARLGGAQCDAAGVVIKDTNCSKWAIAGPYNKSKTFDITLPPRVNELIADNYGYTTKAPDADIILTNPDKIIFNMMSLDDVRSVKVPKTAKIVTNPNYMEEVKNKVSRY